ncbi:MAG: methyltransferase family protein [Myxococcales bacterium]
MAGSRAALRREAIARTASAAVPVCVQRPATGFAGAFSVITLYSAYTAFQGRLAGGGPDWAWLWGFRSIARDYIDILLCVVVAFSVMVTFEKAVALVRWLAIAAVAGAALEIANASVRLSSLGQVSFTQPELVLAGTALGIWALLAGDLAWRLRHGLAPALENRREVPWRHALRSGFFRWLALWSVFSVALIFYEGSRLYAGIPAGSESYYLNWRVTAAALWGLFTVGGLPYCVLTVRRRSRLREDRSDPGLVLILLGRRAASGGLRELWRLLVRRRVRVVLLDLLVKLFWAPLMVTFIYSECGAFHDGLRGSVPIFGRAGLVGGLDYLGSAFVGGPGEPFLDATYRMLYHALFVIDCTLALLGYVTSSRWLGTKSKSVELTAFGWGVALVCYPPFNSLTGTILPYDVNPNPRPYWILSTLGVHHAFMAVTLLLFSIYVWATVAFGLRFSNLTHRGILNTGPYRYIRHPAYATKNLAWWAESLAKFGSPWQFVYLAGLNCVYVLRALTEERHLMQHEDYRRYAKQVRWRFIPGLI